MSELMDAPALRTKSADFAFEQALQRFRWKWRAGLLLHGLVRTSLWTGATFVALGVLDYYSGFSDRDRESVAGLVALVALAGALYAFWQVGRFSDRQAALAADELLGTGRREALAALEFGASSADEDANGSLGSWLRSRAVAIAAVRLDRLQFIHPAFKHTARQAVALLAIVGLPWLIASEPARVIAGRLLHPSADIPPWSPLSFALSPTSPEALYGGEIVITAQITGARIDVPVHFLTRDRATRQIEDSPAFQIKPEQYSRKLEKVAAPLDIAFAVGHARSRWQPLTVRTQPKIQDITLTVEPPAYSGLPRREFPAGAQSLAALAGSRITARVNSNRPLGGGALTIQAALVGKPAKEISAEHEETRRVRFTWTVRNPARLTLLIHDVAGANSEPFEFEQKVTPDERPQAALRQPAGDVLATPDSELPLEGVADDDLGLARVALVRRLNGYRERSAAELLPSATRHYELSRKLNLAPFGLRAGQTVDLTLEAGDNNPSMLGLGVSEPARIHIITREQYAEMLRKQTTLEEFSARYELLRQALEEARKSLDALDAAAGSGDAARAEEARKQALEAHKKAGEIFGKIARDFPLFDLDAGVATAAQDAMTRLFENATQLQELWRAKPDELADALPTLKERLGKSEAAMATELGKGERAVAAAKVYEQAGKFSELIEAQRALVGDFDRVTEEIRRGEMKAAHALNDLADRQHAIAESLAALDRDLSAEAAALPEEFAELKGETEKFLEGLHELEIPPPMAEAETAARAAQSKTADDRASEALARLEALLRRKNGFCAMCRGGGEDPFSLPPDLAETLKQLMQSLIPKPGGGNQQGKTGSDGAAGAGGSSDHGYAMKGKLPHLPIYGPPRLRLSHKATAGLGEGEGEGKANGEHALDVGADRLAAPEHRASDGEGQAATAVPEAYREAVKRYFSPEGNNPPAATPATPAVP